MPGACMVCLPRGCCGCGGVAPVGGNGAFACARVANFLFWPRGGSSYSQGVRPVECGRYLESASGHFEIAVATRGRVRIPSIVKAGESVVVPVAAFTGNGPLRSIELREEDQDERVES